MRKFTPVLMALTFSTLCLNAESLYIVPLNAEGTLTVNESGEYTDVIPMSVDENGTYYASNVKIPNGGFYFYKVIDTDNSTLYGLPGWAAHPVVFDLPNPLTISTPSRYNIPISEGVYDISYYTKNFTGQTYQLFTINESESQQTTNYPDHIYIIGANNQATPIPQSEYPGVYYAKIQVPQNFKIAYEPRYSIDTFIYGPTSGDTSVTLDEMDSVPIQHGEGTKAVFNISPNMYSQAPVGQAMITVNLQNNTVTATKEVVLSVDATEADKNDAPRYYTISGLLLENAPTRAGIYIVRQGNTANKILIH